MTKKPRTRAARKRWRRARAKRMAPILAAWSDAVDHLVRRIVHQRTLFLPPDLWKAWTDQPDHGVVIPGDVE